MDQVVTLRGGRRFAVRTVAALTAVLGVFILTAVVAYAVPTFRTPDGATTAQNGYQCVEHASANLTIAVPSGAVADDLLLAYITFNGGSTMSINTPAGWNLIPGTRQDNGTNVGHAAFWRFHNGSEPANYTWTITRNSGTFGPRASGAMIAYSGVHMVNPIMAVGTAATGNSTSAAAPLIAGASIEANGRVVPLWAIDGGATTATVTTASPSATAGTTRADIANPGECGGNTGPRAHVRDRAFATTGGTDTVTSTVTLSATSQWLAQHIVLRERPAAETPPVVTFLSARTLPDMNPIAPGGWSNRDIEVFLTCTDPETGVMANPVSEVLQAALAIEGLPSFLLTSGSPPCRNGAGQFAAPILVGPFFFDFTKPEVELTALQNYINASTRTPYTVGTWTRHRVEATFTCTDGGDGYSPLTPQLSYTQIAITGSSTQSYGTTLSSTFNIGPAKKCADAAGNVADELTVGPIMIEWTRPTIQIQKPAPNERGWYNTDVTVDFVCVDAAGPVQSGTTSPVQSHMFTTEGSSLSVSSSVFGPDWCKDEAGNVATHVTASGIKLDKTPPVCTVRLSPNPILKGGTMRTVTAYVEGPADLSGTWFDTLESITGTHTPATDLSGWVIGTNDKSGQLRGTVGNTYVFEYSRTDNAGNQSLCTPKTAGSDTVTVQP